MTLRADLCTLLQLARACHGGRRVDRDTSRRKPPRTGTMKTETDSRYRLRVVDIEAGCGGGDYGYPCPFRLYSGGPIVCALTGHHTTEPAPKTCPLRTSSVFVCRK